MKKFKPHTIQHIQLDEFDTFKPSNNNYYYLVIWWRSFPLGHIWLNKTDLLVNTTLLRVKVADAVEKAIDYYFSLSGIEGEQSLWRQYFLQKENLKVKELLDKFNFIQPKDPRFDKKLSIIICTRNRPQAIEECIKSLLNSNDKDFEIIVVDNAPSDNSTEKIIEKYPIIKYIKEPRKGLDIARNIGARFATNEIVAYTDDDVVVPPNWTQQLKELFTDPLTMAITGMVIPVSLAKKSQYTFERYWGFNKGYLPQLFDEEYFKKQKDTGVPVWHIGAGANMAFRRDVFDTVGWFDERLDVGASGCSGDSEFWYRILAEGFNCHYFPQLFVYHKHREDSKSLNHQIFSYMRGHVSSVLVQYENYHFNGELHYLKRTLPKMYIKRIIKECVNLELNSLLSTLNEVHGCISGWLFYRKNTNVKRSNNILYLKSLEEDVVLDDNTLISVIIPCYNYGHFLADAIESVRKQSFRKFEIVVVDDGSTDDTAQICKTFPEVVYIKTNHIGLSGARNFGINYASGDFVVFLDADDYLYPEAFQINLNYFAEHKNVAFVSGAHDKVDNDGKILKNEIQQEKLDKNFVSLLQGNYIAMEGTVMYKKDLFFTFFFDPRLKACEDYDINLNITRYFPSITHREKIAAYRIHNQNMSADKSLMLDSVLTVMQRQKNQLKTDEEFAAYQSGIENWKSIYQL